MVHSSGFEFVRRHRHHNHMMMDRDLVGDTAGLLGHALQNTGNAVGNVLGVPAANSGGDSSSSGGGSSSASGSDGNNGGSTAGAGSGTTAGTGEGTTAGTGGASGSSDSASGSSNGGVNNVAAPSSTAATPASASAAAAAAAASVTPAASAATSSLSAALTTMLVTASDGTIATSVLPVGPVPSSDPFGNVAVVNGSTDNASQGVSSIIVPPGGYGSSSDSGGDSDSSNNNKIIIPVAIVAGILALGLLVALILQKQRNSVEREMRKPMMMSDKANLIAATSGGMGFTAAGMFRRNRRGSDYQKSSNGHGRAQAGAGDHQSWLADRPLSQAITSGDIAYDDTSSLSSSAFDHQQKEMMANGISRPGSVFNGTQQSHQYGQALSSNMHNNGPMDSDSSQGGHNRQSLITGEGGYATASEEGGPTHGSFFNHNQPKNDVAEEDGSLSHYDGSASHGYTNPAAKGLDAASVQGATGGQMLSPYADVQRNDARHSMANTELSSGQAYDGADLGEDPFNLADESEARPNPHYDGNRVMQHGNLNSSRWSG